MTCSSQELNWEIAQTPATLPFLNPKPNRPKPGNWETSSWETTTLFMICLLRTPEVTPSSKWVSLTKNKRNYLEMSTTTRPVPIRIIWMCNSLGSIPHTTFLTKPQTIQIPPMMEMTPLEMEMETIPHQMETTKTKLIRSISSFRTTKCSWLLEDQLPFS